MAQIDVSDLLSDPDFTDLMSLVTRTPRTDRFGQNVMREAVLVSVGSVQPASAETVQKLPEAMRVADVRSFWFKGAIEASAPGQYSSILIFKGKRYQVQTVADWTSWGAGWSEGTCVAEVPA